MIFSTITYITSKMKSMVSATRLISGFYRDISVATIFEFWKVVNL